MEIPKYRIALDRRRGEALALGWRGCWPARASASRWRRAKSKSSAPVPGTGARAFACDATDADEVERLFGMVEREIGSPDVVVL